MLEDSLKAGDMFLGRQAVLLQFLFLYLKFFEAFLVPFGQILCSGTVFRKGIYFVLHICDFPPGLVHVVVNVYDFLGVLVLPACLCYAVGSGELMVLAMPAGAMVVMGVLSPFDAARKADIITAEEADKLGDLHRAVREVIEVDSFDPSHFENPRRFDAARSPNRGGGVVIQTPCPARELPVAPGR